MKIQRKNKVLLVHGWFLLVVTIGNTISSLLGLYKGVGPFSFNAQIPMAEVGLFQAYLLMMLIGIVLLLNVRQAQSWRYDVLGIVAHLIPLAALFLFQDVVKEIMGENIFMASALIHIPWILIEFITSIRQYKIENGTIS